MPLPSSSTSRSTPNALSSIFTKKKAHILATLDQSTDVYSDKSPKGSVDAEIVDLIAEINAFEGWVTTSSCAGRVSVFVEGRKGLRRGGTGDGEGEGEEEQGIGLGDEDPTERARSEVAAVKGSTQPTTSSGAGPGGKGHGNKWLYVSHSPVPDSHLSSVSDSGLEDLSLHSLFQLEPSTNRQSVPQSHQSQTQHQHQKKSPSLRLIKLAFSPLILHVLCADLRAAKPLLAAAINAGFRESGVQSLRVLDEEHAGAGVMVGIRTAGLGFETVVGYVDESDDAEVYRCCVDETYLRMCTAVINERFEWNVERRERLRAELRQAVNRNRRARGGDEWEGEDMRRERKKREGLARREMERGMREKESVGAEEEKSNGVDEEDVLDGGLFLHDT